MSDADRLTELEIRVAHQESQIDDLSQTVYAQWQIIDKLTAQGKRLSARLQELLENPDPSQFHKSE